MFIAHRHKKHSAPLGAACHIALLTERKLPGDGSNYKHIAATQQNEFTYYPNISLNASSSITVTPSDCALSSFDPAASPATT